MSTRPANPTSRHTSLYRHSPTLHTHLVQANPSGPPLPAFPPDQDESLRIISDPSPPSFPSLSRPLICLHGFCICPSLMLPLRLFSGDLQSPSSPPSTQLPHWQGSRPVPAWPRKFTLLPSLTGRDCKSHEVGRPGIVVIVSILGRRKPETRVLSVSSLVSGD